MQSPKTQMPGAATIQEILSQPDIWSGSLGQMKQSALFRTIVAESRPRREWLFLGCGTSFYLAEAAASSWRLITGQRAYALPASELLLFPTLTLPVSTDLQAVVVSRSGTTSEVLLAAKLLSQELHLATLGVTCASASRLGEICTLTISTASADEKSTVMTRSFTSMLLVLQQLAAVNNAESHIASALDAMVAHFRPLLPPLASRIEAFVAKHTFADYVFLGHGPFHAIAREASLKVTEMSCSHGRVFHTLEFRHGPKAAVGPGTCLMFFLSGSGGAWEEQVLTEMKRLGPAIIAVCNRASRVIRHASDLVVELDWDGPEIATLAPFIVPAQLLGYFTGIKKGLDPDDPRHLSRVVILD